MIRKVFPLILAPILSLCFLMLSNGFLLTFVSAKLNTDGFSSFSIGLIQSFYYGGFLLAALLTELSIKRVQHIQAYAFFASIAAACSLFSAFAATTFDWIICRFIMGVSIAALYVVIESWLLLISSIKNRGVILGIYMICIYLAQSLSQYIMDFISIDSLSPFVIAGILATLSVLPVTFSRSKIPYVPSPPTRDLWRLLYIAPLGTLGCIVSGMILGSLYAFLPIYAQMESISISLTMSITIAGGFLLQYPLGHLSDIIDRRKVVLLVCVMAIISAVVLILVSGLTKWVYVSCFVLGGCVFTLYPLSITQVIDRTDTADITKVTGVMLFAYSIGSVIGPLLTPLFIRIFGNSGLIYSLLFYIPVLLLVGFVTCFIRKPVPKAKQESFVALPSQTPVGYDLDPRGPGNDENTH